MRLAREDDPAGWDKGDGKAEWSEQQAMAR